MSRILTVPFLSSSRLAGLMSRWTTPFAVGELQATGRLQDVVDGLVDRKRAVLLDQGRQVAPLDVLHDQEVDAVGLVGIVGGDDVRMAELGRGFDLSLESEPTAAASFIMAGGSILIATMRSMRRCSALKTWPMPPAPILSRMV